MKKLKGWTNGLSPRSKAAKNNRKGRELQIIGMGSSSSWRSYRLGGERKRRFSREMALWVFME